MADYWFVVAVIMSNEIVRFAQFDLGKMQLHGTRSIELVSGRPADDVVTDNKNQRNKLLIWRRKRKRKNTLSLRQFCKLLNIA